jgi:proline dehydrogenase
MVAEFPESTGIVIQSYLYRSEKDEREIVAHGGRIRLCKGAYQEPANLAFPKKADTDKNYDRLAAMMLDAAKAHGAPQISEDGRIAPPPAFATHDPKRIAFVKQYAQELGLDKKALEFQMLNGIRRDLQEQSAAEGYPVRVYVPFGTEWYPYFTRRLAERPANVWFILSNALRR